MHFFRTTREHMFKKPLEAITPPGAATAARWAALREALEPFAKDADARGLSDTFLLNERETYADVVAAGWLAWARRIWGADTQEWAELETWHGGRWSRLTRAFQKWEYVDNPSAPDVAKCVLFCFVFRLAAEGTLPGHFPCTTQTLKVLYCNTWLVVREIAITLCLSLVIIKQFN